MGAGRIYPSVGKPLGRVPHLVPEVCIGNMSQQLINTSSLGCLPFLLPPQTPSGASWDHLRNKPLDLESLAQGLLWESGEF